MEAVTGKQKVLFSRRLGDSWEELATYLDIPNAPTDRLVNLGFRVWCSSPIRS